MQEWELTPEEIRKKLDEMEWSFSRVNAYGSCNYAWYLSYLEKQSGEENAYAQFGTLCHKCIELFLNGELDIFTAAQWYQDHYRDYVTCDFPPNKYTDLGQKAYDQGLDYFNNISFDFDRYEVLGVEKEYHFKVGEYKFKGYIDALLRDKQNGEIIILDQKSSSFKYLKDGSVSKSNQQQFDHYVKQEYIYSIPVLEEYGRVDWLTWNMFRDQKILKLPFEQNKLEETKQWAVDTIHQIEQEILWAPDDSKSFFCNILCDHRNSCIYRPVGG